MSEVLTLINGSFEQHINVADRGLAYGDGLFETIRVEQGSPEYWKLHLDRLLDGCRRLNIAIDEQQLCTELYQDVTTLLNQQSKNSSVVKIVITRGVGPRGYGYSADIVPTRICSLSQTTNVDFDLKEQGASLFRCRLSLSDQPLLAGIKHLNRMEQVLARSEWRSDFYEGLLTNADGYVIEAVMSNVFMVKGNQLLTPQLNTAGVAGIMRNRVIAWAESENCPLSVEKISLEAFKAADHLFVCNSLSGVVPIKLFDDKNYSIWPLHKTMDAWLADDAKASHAAFTLGSK